MSENAIDRLGIRLDSRGVEYKRVGQRHITWTMDDVRWDAHATIDGQSIWLKTGKPLTSRQVVRVAANVGRKTTVVDGAVGHTICQCGGLVYPSDKYCRHCGCLLLA